MANLGTAPNWDDVIQLEKTDRVLGGAVPTGISNRQAEALTNRTDALNIGVVKGPRNCVLSGAVSSGLPNYGTFSGTNLTIDGTTTPIIFNFAAGFSEFGTTDVVVEYSDSAVLDFSAATNGQTFFVFALNTGGVISFVKVRNTSDIAYHATPTTPSFIAADQFWYDPNSGKTYREVSGAWVEVQAIFLGGVEKNTTCQFFPKPYGLTAYDSISPCGAILPWPSISVYPQGFANCVTTSLFIAAYPELYNLIGTLYGGSGEVFSLPNITSQTFGTDTIPVKFIIKLY